MGGDALVEYGELCPFCILIENLYPLKEYTAQKLSKNPSKHFISEVFWKR